MSNGRFSEAAPDRAMRRHWGGSHSDEFSGPLYVRRVPLDSGGYTKGRYPQYFGVGAPLYRVSSEDDLVDFYLRDVDHAAAKAAVRRMYPGAAIR